MNCSRRIRTVPHGYQLVSPNGGWAWVVLTGMAFLALFASIHIICFGICLNEIKAVINESVTTLSWTPSIMFSTAMFSVMIAKYSCRVTIIIGGILSSVGITLCYFATSHVALFICHGVILGLGHGMSTCAMLIALSDYFTSYYGIATGITLGSMASGKFLFSPVVQLLLEEYGFHGTYLILGGITLHMCVGGVLLQPAKWHRILVPISGARTSADLEVEKENAMENGKTNTCQQRNTDASEVIKMTEVQPAANPPFNERSKLREKNYMSENSEENEEAHPLASTPSGAGIQPASPHYIDFTLLKLRVFYVQLASGTVVLMTAISLSIFLPPFCIEKGLLPMEAALASSARAAGEIIGRIAAPFIQRYFKKRLSSRHMYIVMAAIHSVLVLGLTWASSVLFTIVVAILGGIFFGGLIGMTMVMMMNCVGATRLNSTLGLTKFIQGFFSLAICPLLGFLRDATGSFDVPFYCIAGAQLIVCGAWIVKSLTIAGQTHPSS